MKSPKIVPIKWPKWKIEKVEKGDKVWFEIFECMDNRGIAWELRQQIEDEQVAMDTYLYILAQVKRTLIRQD